VKFREVFRYELAHRLRSPSTWVYFAALFVLGYTAILGATPRSAAIHVNAPLQLATLMMLMSVLGLVVSASLFGDAAVRDVQVEMDPLLFTSSMREAEYLRGRFLAALATNALVLFAIPLGLAVSTLVGRPDSAALGPFRAAAFLQPYLLLLLPSAVLSGAVLFSVGVRSRQIVPVYLSAVGLFIVFMMFGADAPPGEELHPLLGPLGFQALNQVTRYWTAAEQNTRLIGFPGILLLNRLVLLAVAGAVLGMLHLRFRFAHPDGGRRRRREKTIVAPESAPRVSVVVPTAVKAFGFRTAVRQTLAVARNSLLEVAANRWFVVVLIACVGLTLLWGHNVGDTVFDTSTWPVTLLVTEIVLSGRSEPIFYLLIALYAGELVWKDRDVSAAEIADAVPMAEAAALFGRFLALIAMLMMCLVAAIVGGILIQAFQGYYNFEPGLYLRVVFGLNLADYVVFAVLAMTIHVVVNQKYIGHFAVVMTWIFTMFAGQLGIRHHLLVYNGRPGWAYSDMNGFGPYIEPIVWFKLYWAAWALLLGVVACVLWVRGRESGMRHRLNQARARFAGPALRTASVATLLILTFGGFIFYNTNILNEYTTDDDQGRLEAEYEKRYGRFEEVAQPTLTTAGLRVEIYPDERTVDLRGSYRLVNKTNTPIDSVHVYVKPDLQTRSISFDRPAKSVLTDEEVGYRIYALERALNPGESMQLSFDVAFRQRGFPNDGLQTDVVSNGAYFDRTWLPFIGYQRVFELTEDAKRKDFGLERVPPLPGPEVIAARGRRWPIRNEDKVPIEVILGTSADQTAITPGLLRREWTENGRRYFQYQLDNPLAFSPTVFSGRYATLDDRWQDVALRIDYHPDHAYNLDTFVRSMKASLDYFTTQFGPYHGKQLRIVEIPRYGHFGRAHAQTIAFTEDNFFTRVKEGEFDQVFFGTAHETAHQWWGGQVRGATGVRGGQGFLSESLANYSAMMVTEKTAGLEAARKVYDFQMNRYLSRRGQVARDVPLLQVEDQSYIAYGKGAVAMYLLRDYIGADAVNTALRRYLEKNRAAVPPYPTSLDVYVELQAVTPDSLKYLLTDLFETITLWDVKTTRAVVDSIGNGEHVVTLVVVAKKMRADSIGKETEVPMSDFVEIGIFAPGQGNALGEPLYLERHRIKSGGQTIRITVPRAPARAGIDPMRKLIERDRNDNVLDVKAAAASQPSRGE
jgi:hypothetical protein